MKYTSIDSMNIFQARKQYDDLTITELCILDEEKIFNGCGGKGGVSFDEILEIVEKFNYFNNNLFEKFRRELKEKCKKHDYKYWIGGKWYDKIIADIELSNWLFMNLQWTEWYIPIASWIASMIWLTLKGKKYFNFS